MFGTGSSMAIPAGGLKLVGGMMTLHVRAVSLSEFAGVCSAAASYLLKPTWLEIAVPGSVIAAGSISLFLP